MSNPDQQIAAPAAPVRSVRSTLLLSSRTSLASAGLFERYESHLGERTRNDLSHLIAGTWLPVALANEHYVACEALGLSRSAQVALGRANGERLSGTLLGTLAKLARAAGTTPLQLIEQFPRFWGRIFEGGGITYHARGPKDVEVYASSSLLQYAHFRNGLCGTAESIVKLVCSRLFVRITAHAGSTATLLMQWV